MGRIPTEIDLCLFASITVKKLRNKTFSTETENQTTETVETVIFCSFLTFIEGSGWKIPRFPFKHACVRLFVCLFVCLFIGLTYVRVSSASSAGRTWRTSPARAAWTAWASQSRSRSRRGWSRAARAHASGWCAPLGPASRPAAGWCPSSAVASRRTSWADTPPPRPSRPCGHPSLVA